MKKLIVFVMFVFVVGCGKPWIPLFTGDCVTNAVIATDALRKQGFVSELAVEGYKLPNGKHFYHCYVRYQDKKTGEWMKVQREACQMDQLGGVTWP